MLLLAGLWEALDRSVCFRDSQLCGRGITADDCKLSRCVTQFSSQPLCLLSTINAQRFDRAARRRWWRWHGTCTAHMLTPSSHGIPRTLQEDIIFYGTLMILAIRVIGEKIIFYHHFKTIIMQKKNIWFSLSNNQQLFLIYKIGSLD